MKTDNRISRRTALKRMGMAALGGAAVTSGLVQLTSCDAPKARRIILYFTGTGNCLYVARELADENTELLSIPQLVKRAAMRLKRTKSASSILSTGTCRPIWCGSSSGRRT